jgi:TonB-linked SusC/RagA family outer membrane protein
MKKKRNKTSKTHLSSPVSLRFVVVLLLGAVFNTALCYSQSTAVSLELKNVTIEEVLYELEKKTDFHFIYNSKLVNVDRKITIDAKNEQLETLLQRLFASTDVLFEVAGKHIILSKSEQLPEQQADQSKKSIYGVVRDASGKPMVGVNIIEIGSHNGSISDLEGKFSLSVKESSSLRVSLIGYITKEFNVRGKSVFEIVLVEDNKLLDEVIVVGYGTQKKGNLTGAISSIKSDEIMTTTHSSLAQNLQGKVSGLQIRQQAGEPGEFNTNINIRGFGSPLYVIDGIARDGSSDFQRLNPNDIESISVLKDASAAIYGFNAGNGVILVTTKKGAKGAPKFVYNGSIGFQRPTDVPKMATAAQLQEMLVDANVNIGLLPSITKEELEKWKQGVPGYESTNWYDEVMKKQAYQIQHNISVTGGNSAVDYFISFGYLNEEGLLKSNDISYDKYSVRSNLSAKLSNHLTAEVFLSGRYDTRKNPGDFYWIFKAAQISLPTESPYANNNTNYLYNTTFDNNPVALMERDQAGYIESKNKVFQSSGSLTYDAPFLKGFQLKGTAAYDSNNSIGKTLRKTYNLYTYDASTQIYNAEQQNAPARISNSNGDFDRLVLQAQASYNNTFNRVHNVGATAVYEQTKTNYRYSWIQRQYDFYTNDQINQAGKDNQESDGYEDESANMSYVGRLNYNYAGKYLMEFAFRYDGSYRYNPDNRWDLFPVVSAGWRISEERFIKDNIHFLNNLKLRTSYGKVGENAGTPFQYIAGYTIGGGGYEFTDGSYTVGIASPSITTTNLTWYTANILNLGVDIGLFNSRLNVEFDVYQRDREGILATRSLTVPNTFGASLPQENLNTDRVRGIELMLSHQNKIRDFSYGINFNFNYARTMNLYIERSGYTSSYDRWRNGNVNRWNDILWGYELNGQFQDYEDIIQSPLHETGNYGNDRQLPGSFKFEDVNGDGIIDGKDQLPLFYGGQPKFHYGLTLSAGYKGIDLNVLMQGSGKYTVRFREVYASMLAFNANTPAYFYDRWHLSDPYDPGSEWIPGTWPAIRTSEHSAGMYRESSAFRKDASYLRIKNVEIGYTFPAKQVKKLLLESVRIYANGHNLFTFADSFVKPFDPEKIEGSFSAGFTYPLTTSFNFGLNVTF